MCNETGEDLEVKIKKCEYELEKAKQRVREIEMSIEMEKQKETEREIEIAPDIDTHSDNAQWYCKWPVVNPNCALLVFITMISFCIADTVYFDTVYKSCKASGEPCKTELAIQAFLSAMWLSWPVLYFVVSAFYCCMKNVKPIQNLFCR